MAIEHGTIIPSPTRVASQEYAFHAIDHLAWIEEIPSQWIYQGLSYGDLFKIDYPMMLKYKAPNSILALSSVDSIDEL